MSTPLTKKTIDFSEMDSFSFGFYCDICGKEWKSHRVPFVMDGFSDIKNEDVKHLIYMQEHKLAFEAANLEAHLLFSRCEKCGKRVCDECFVFDGEQCKECSGLKI